MNPRRRKLLITATFIVVGVSAATLLGLKAFQENLLYFYSPSQIALVRLPRQDPFVLVVWLWKAASRGIRKV